MLVRCNALHTLCKGTPLTRTNASHTPLRAMVLLLLLSTQLFNAAHALATDKSDGGSSLLQSELPSQPLLDHTQPHFLPNRSGIVQLFEWKFADIATECEQFLGPHGFAGVQVSPIAEHLVVRSAAVANPWWERYQPVSYQIASRSGSMEEFQQMISACNAAGVRVFVDVVLNHMAGAYDEETASGRRLLEGYAGSTANGSSYDFSAVPFTSRHFHKPCELTNYLDAHVVRNCEFNGWPDLNHYRLDVRGNLTEFLNRVVDMGVAGFRVDAAKYIWPIDIKLLFKDVKNLNSDEFDFPEKSRPYVYQDVVDLGVDAISKTEYSSYGMVSEYLYAAELANIINGKAPLSTLLNWGPAMGFLPHQQAVVFVDSHDGQRDSKLLGANQLLSYRQPRKYIMATAFMLAHPYGRVKRIMSSYYFTAEQPEQGPPMAEGEPEEQQEDEQKEEGEADEADNVDADALVDPATPEEEEVEVEEPVTTDAPPQARTRSPTFDPATSRCEFASGWVCEHRWPPIVQMVELANTLNDVEDGVLNFQTDGLNHIAFCRGNKAFFAFNNDAQLAYEAEVETCLPSGVYCDVISGGSADSGKVATDCVGKHVVVDEEGKARIMLPAALGVGEEGMAAGSDYDTADVEANDAYGIALGEEGEFGVLAIHEGSRLENNVAPSKQDAVKETDGTSVDQTEKDTVKELAAEDNAAETEVAEDAEDAEDAKEIADTTDEDASPEALEDMTVGKNAKLEEAATDASVENDEGEAPVEEGDEEALGEEDEETADEKVAAEVEEAEPPVEEDVGEEPAVDEAEPAVEEGEVAADGNENAETGEAVEEAADAEEPNEQADAAVVEEPEIVEDPSEAVDTADAAETGMVDEEEEGIGDEGKSALEEIENEVKDAVRKVEEEIAENINKGESGLATGIKADVEKVANKTKEVIAKAGFNVNGAGTLQRYELPSAKSSLTINPR